MARNARYVLTAIAALAAAYSILWAWRTFATLPAWDFYHYYVHAQIAGHTPADNVYSADAQRQIGEEMYARAAASGSKLHAHDAQHRRVLDSTGTPLLYATFAWLPRDYERAVSLHRLILLLAFAAAMTILGRCARLPLAVSLFFTAVLVRYFFPLKVDLLLGNVGALQLLGAALFIATTARFPALAAMIVTLLVAYKPNIAAVLLLLLLSRLAARDFTRLRRELAGGLAGAAIAFVAGSLYYRSFQVWLDWFPVAADFTRRLPVRAEHNYAPLLVLLQRDGVWWSYLAYAALLLPVAVCLWRRPRPTRDALLVGLGILIHLLAANTFWLHYAVLALVPAVALLRDRWAVPFVLVCVTLLAGEPIEAMLGRPVFDIAAWLLPPAVLALYVLSLVAFWRSTDRGGSADSDRERDRWRV